MSDEVRLRYHVEGETSTEGARWQIWDGEQGFAPFHGFADQDMAKAFCARLNEHARPTAVTGQLEGKLIRELVEALKVAARTLELLNETLADRGEDQSEGAAAVALHARALLAKAQPGGSNAHSE